MALRRSDRIILLLLLFGIGIGNAQAQKWFTPEVASEVGREPCDNCMLGRRESKLVKVGNGRITPVTMFYFDTIASYAQGIVVDMTTGKPIRGAIIQTRYSCWKDCDQKTAATNEAGFFRLGWIGCHGPKSGRSNRSLLIQTAGYPTINTEAVDFGGGAYLHIELVALRMRR